MQRQIYKKQARLLLRFPNTHTYHNSNISFIVFHNIFLGVELLTSHLTWSNGGSKVFKKLCAINLFQIKNMFQLKRIKLTETTFCISTHTIRPKSWKHLVSYRNNFLHWFFSCTSFYKKSFFMTSFFMTSFSWRVFLWRVFLWRVFHDEFFYDKS